MSTYAQPGATTPAEERAIDAVSLFDAENAVFRSDVTRGDLVQLVRHVLDAATTVEPVAEDLAKRHAPHLWDPEHRAALLRFVHPDAGPDAEVNIDRAITMERHEVHAIGVERARKIRAILLGEHA